MHDEISDVLAMYGEDRKRLQAFEEWANTHGDSADNALMLFSERMGKAAAEVMTDYNRIKDDPEARARQDASFMTTEGLRMSAELVQGAANRADKAREALRILREDEEE